MGKLIAFWAPVKGHAHVTSCAAEVACELSLNRGSAVALTIVPGHKSGIEGAFKAGLPSEIREEIYKKSGLKALWIMFRQEKPDREKVRKCALKTYGDGPDLFPGCREADMDDDRTKRAVTQLVLSELKKAYDHVLIDAGSGDEDEYTLSVLAASDAVVCLLPQSFSKTEEFFSEHENDMVFNNSVFAINGYFERSSAKKQKLALHFSKELKHRKLKTVVHNTAFMDVAEEGNVYRFFKDNRVIKRKDKNHEFFSDVRELTDAVLEVCGK